MPICDKCGGTGEVPDDREVGKEMRRRRMTAGFTLRDVARHMQISAPYLSDIELGRRRLTPERRRTFNAVIGYTE